MAERENGGEVKHIFGGIPEHLFDDKLTPAENLESLKKEFKRVGVKISDGVKIDNSSINQLVIRCNILLKPLKQYLSKDDLEIGDPKALILAEISDRQSDNLEDLELAQAQRDLMITIGEGAQIGKNVSIDLQTRIGERVKIGNFVTIRQNSTIGKDSKIGEGAEISFNCKIGSNCVIGNHAFINNGASLGDRVTVEEGVVMGEDMEVESGASVIQKGGPDESQMAVVKKKGSHLKITE